MAQVPFKGNRKPAPSQDKRDGRMPRKSSGKVTEESFGRGAGNIRPVDPGDGLVRGNDIPKPLGS